MEAGIGVNTSETADSTGNGNTYLEGWCGTEDREHHLQTADGKEVMCQKNSLLTDRVQAGLSKLRVNERH